MTILVCVGTSTRITVKSRKGIGRRYIHSNTSRYPPQPTHHHPQVEEAQKKAIAESESNVQGWVKKHFA